jgi:hypothetical protein
MKTSKCWSSLSITCNFSAILRREQLNYQSDDDDVRFVLDQHAELDMFSASPLKQQFAGKNVTIYLSSSNGTFFLQIITRHPYGNRLCSSPLQLFLYSYESEFIQKLIKDKKK